MQNTNLFSTVVLLLCFFIQINKSNAHPEYQDALYRPAVAALTGFFLRGGIDVCGAISARVCCRKCGNQCNCNEEDKRTNGKKVLDAIAFGLGAGGLYAGDYLSGGLLTDFGLEEEYANKIRAAIGVVCGSAVYVGTELIGNLVLKCTGHGLTVNSRQGDDEVALNTYTVN